MAELSRVPLDPAAEVRDLLDDTFRHTLRVDLDTDIPAAVETVMKLRARWVAEALDEAADEWNPAVLDDSGNSIAQTLRELAAEYRDGAR